MQNRTGATLALHGVVVIELGLVAGLLRRCACAVSALAIAGIGAKRALSSVE